MPYSLFLCNRGNVAYHTPSHYFIMYVHISLFFCCLLEAQHYYVVHHNLSLHRLCVWIFTCLIICIVKKKPVYTLDLPNIIIIIVSVKLLLTVTIRLRIMYTTSNPELCLKPAHPWACDHGPEEA